MQAFTWSLTVERCAHQRQSENVDCERKHKLEASSPKHLSIVSLRVPAFNAIMICLLEIQNIIKQIPYTDTNKSYRKTPTSTSRSSLKCTDFVNTLRIAFFSRWDFVSVLRDAMLTVELASSGEISANLAVPSAPTFGSCRDRGEEGKGTPTACSTGALYRHRKASMRRYSTTVRIHDED